MANNKQETVVPYSNSTLTKKEQVAKMFDSIAHRYDFLNHFFSAGIDHIWRWQAINMLKSIEPKTILDVATGTGDLAIAAMRLKPEKVIGIDISQEMMALGREKLAKKKMDKVIELAYGDAENLSYQDNSFDGITVGFGVRNFENIEKGIGELYRVLRPGGKLVVLEFSKPRYFPIKQLYNFYFNNILPLIGKLVSKDNSAYTYLPASVEAFPEGKAFEQMLKNTGFKSTIWKELTFGICSIYVGEK